MELEEIDSVCGVAPLPLSSGGVTFAIRYAQHILQVAHLSDTMMAVHFACFAAVQSEVGSQVAFGKFKSARDPVGFLG